MSLTSDLNAIKTVQDGVKNNKVTRFAYTQTAYDNNDVNGHDDYVATRDNNIPLSDLSVIQVNQTVVDKGFRARASSLTRMLLNHLFGRVSYNLNKVNDLFNDLLVKIVANLGVANGLATLDATGRIPYSQLPEDAMEYQGDWNASTNTPTLVDGTGTKGDTYNVSVAGTQTFGGESIYFFVGDRVIYNGSVWQRFSSGNVQSVCEILPETNGNVDLSKQRDITKILSNNILSQLGFSIGKVWIKEEVQPSRVNNIYRFNNKFFACMTISASSNCTGIISSEDGTHWSNTGMTTTCYQMVYGKGVYVARIAGKGLWWSEDGINWTQVTVVDSSIDTANVRLYFVGDLFIGLNAGDSYVYTSSNGKDWTKVITAGSDLLKGSAYYANGVYLIGMTSAWLRSTNGVNWTKYTVTGSVYDYIFLDNTFYRLLGTSSGMSIQKSTNNGVSWSTIRTVTNIGYRFLYVNGRLYTGIDFDSIAQGSSAGFAELDINDNMTVISMSAQLNSPSVMAVIYNPYINLYILGCGTASGSSATAKVGGIYVSKDGSNWIEVIKPTNLSYGTGVISFSFTENIILAGRGVSGGLWYSSSEAITKYINGE